MPWLFLRGYRNVREALKRLIQDWHARNRPDALSLSLGWQVPIARIRQDLNLPDLSEPTLPAYRAQLLKHFYQIRFVGLPRWVPVEWVMRPVKQYVLDCIRMLGIIAKRVPVFVSAGNHGPESLNLLLLAQGVQGVGAVASKGLRAEYSGRNAWVNHWARVNKKFVPVFGPNDTHEGFALQKGTTRKRWVQSSHVPWILPRKRILMRDSHPIDWRVETWQSVEMKGVSCAVPQVAARFLSRKANQESVWFSMKEMVRSWVARANSY